MSDYKTPKSWNDNPGGWLKFKDQVESMDQEELEACGLQRKGETRRGLIARWHANQAMRYACEGLANVLDTPENVLVRDPEKWVGARAAMKAIRALEPLVFGMTDEDPDLQEDGGQSP